MAFPIPGIHGQPTSIPTLPPIHTTPHQILPSAQVIRRGTLLGIQSTQQQQQQRPIGTSAMGSGTTGYSHLGQVQQEPFHHGYQSLPYIMNGSIVGYSGLGLDLSGGSISPTPELEKISSNHSTALTMIPHSVQTGYSTPPSLMPINVAVQLNQCQNIYPASPTSVRDQQLLQLQYRQPPPPPPPPQQQQQPRTQHQTRNDNQVKETAPHQDGQRFTDTTTTQGILQEDRDSQKQRMSQRESNALAEFFKLHVTVNSKYLVVGNLQDTSLESHQTASSEIINHHSLEISLGQMAESRISGQSLQGPSDTTLAQNSRGVVPSHSSQSLIDITDDILAGIQTRSMTRARQNPALPSKSGQSGEHNGHSKNVASLKSLITLSGTSLSDCFHDFALATKDKLQDHKRILMGSMSSVHKTRASPTVSQLSQVVDRTLSDRIQRIQHSRSGRINKRSCRHPARSSQNRGLAGDSNNRHHPYTHPNGRPSTAGPTQSKKADDDDDQGADIEYRRSRSQSGREMFGCTHLNCTRRFATLGLLRSHVVTHRLDRPFWCEECFHEKYDVYPAEEHAIAGYNNCRGVSLGNGASCGRMPWMKHIPLDVPPRGYEDCDPDLEIKRYKRNHDLLRHKREKHPLMEIRMAREAAKQRQKNERVTKHVRLPPIQSRPTQSSRSNGRQPLEEPGTRRGMSGRGIGNKGNSRHCSHRTSSDLNDESVSDDTSQSIENDSDQDAPVYTATAKSKHLKKRFRAGGEAHGTK